jgi:hypothetical protein
MYVHTWSTYTKTWSTIIKTHGQTLSTNMVKHRQNIVNNRQHTWSNIISTWPTLIKRHDRTSSTIMVKHHQTHGRQSSTHMVKHRQKHGIRGCERRWSCCVCMDHRDELEDLFADCASQLASKEASARVLCVGDWNIDEMPVMMNDPWTGRDGRMEHHADKRMLRDGWMTSLSLVLEIPEIAVGCPSPKWQSECLQVPVTRVPADLQEGLASVLDCQCGLGHQILVILGACH